MPVTRRRAATARTPGGASSLLRLSARAARAPERALFAESIDRAVRALRHGSIAPATLV
jgi:hypothetical protein